MLYKIHTKFIHSLYLGFVCIGLYVHSQYISVNISLRRRLNLRTLRINVTKCYNKCLRRLMLQIQSFIMQDF
jgi:hypothetical protein